MVAADGTHAVAGDGSHAVTTDRRARACAAAAARRAQRQEPGPPQTAPRVPHAGREKKLQSFNAPSRNSSALPQSIKMYFSFPPLNAQLTSSGVLVAVFGVCGNGDYGVCYVSQHEEISTRAPRFCVAYQAPHAVARDGSHAVARDGTHAPQMRPMWSPQTEPKQSPETDPMRSPQTGARFYVEYKGSPPLRRPESNLPWSCPASS
jgi:hypothetical protein